MRVGVHVSIRRGFSAALQESRRLKCDAFQVFSRRPRRWQVDDLRAEEISRFKQERRDANIFPLALHSPYLPNLGSSHPEIFSRSQTFLKADLERAALMGAEYLVIHPGAYSPGATLETGIRNIARSLNEVLDKDLSGVLLLIENVAGGGRRIGGRFEEIQELFALVHKKERVGLCLDICHAYGAGHDLSAADNVDVMLTEIDRLVGLSQIKVCHVSNPQMRLGSHLDIHGPLGRGAIPDESFRRFFEAEGIRQSTIILETPVESRSSHEENLCYLRERLLPKNYE